MFGPRDKELTIDEETVQVLEVIENCNASDNDDSFEEYFVEE